MTIFLPAWKRMNRPIKYVSIALCLTLGGGALLGMHRGNIDGQEVLGVYSSKHKDIKLHINGNGSWIFENEALGRVQMGHWDFERSEPSTIVLAVDGIDFDDTQKFVWLAPFEKDWTGQVMVCIDDDSCLSKSH